MPFILPCLNLSRFRALIFNPFTNQRELAEPLSFPYSSCTSKATTTPRRALIHLQPIKASANHPKTVKEKSSMPSEVTSFILFIISNHAHIHFIYTKSNALVYFIYIIYLMSHTNSFHFFIII